MKQVIFKCALIICICALNLVCLADINNFEEEVPDNSSNLLIEFNFSIPLLNLSNLNETYYSACYLQKEENGTLLIINKTRSEVGEDEYPDYTQVCPISVYLLPSTMDSLIGK
uniref:Putative secreted protein n=1 Tax=Panstrongylus lignarius TaxID=156445 RepID=A0A224Y0R7_9HEMI